MASDGPGPLRWTAPILLNLLIGLPATVPLGCAWWLVSEWLPMDCGSVQESYSPGFSGSCNYSTLDNGPVVMGLGAVSGAVVLGLVAWANVSLSRNPALGRATWLRAAPFVVAPFAAWAALALFAG
ncbi:hypothetical protein [Streptomyces longispororuber]|uniref:hypothetical protein n=1 Tax=Streptomyces longispororuber TaxID=68230 RepID=UPI0021096F45|nr:hypothetical protein [Streptomyces longispororuber]MCQ4210183.1 hypothetical protein [Streptomyces longispororuber]